MKNSKPKIVIVGAGIAGLAAAHKLTEHGHFDVKILEARDRIGGRICTNYFFGFPVDVGAGWLHGIEGNPIAELAKQAHVQFVNFKFTDILFFNREGKKIPVKDIDYFRDEFADFLQKAEALAQHASHDVSLEKMLLTVRPSDRTADWYFLWNWMMIYLGLYTGSNLSQLSAKYWDIEETLPGGNNLVMGGYANIIKGFAKNLDIQFNTIVTKINYQDKLISVATNQGEMQCDAVVVTLPLGVLQKDSVQFSPVLPNDKKAAINRLSMGLLNRVVLKFNRVFWPVEHSGFFVEPKNNPAIPYFINLHYYNQQPVLVGTISGSHAQSLETLPDEKIIDIAMTELRHCFGNQIPNPESHIITRWLNDPYSHGSYSYTPVHATPSDYDVLANPINQQLFFAGEATNKQYPATTHGAYLSGIREAQRIIDLFHIVP